MKPSRKTRHQAEHLPGIHNQAWSPSDDFYPMWVGGGGGATKFGARMTEAWTTKQATCQIYTMDGITLTYLANAEVYDPLSVFATLTTNDWLYVTKQDGKYYASDNATCTGTSPLIDTPPATQPV